MSVNCRILFVMCPVLDPPTLNPMTSNSSCRSSTHIEKPTAIGLWLVSRHERHRCSDAFFFPFCTLDIALNRLTRTSSQANGCPASSENACRCPRAWSQDIHMYTVHHRAFSQCAFTLHACDTTVEGNGSGRVDHDMVALQLQQQSHHANDIMTMMTRSGRVGVNSWLRAGEAYAYHLAAIKSKLRLGLDESLHPASA